MGETEKGIPEEAMKFEAPKDGGLHEMELTQEDAEKVQQLIEEMRAFLAETKRPEPSPRHPDDFAIRNVNADTLMKLEAEADRVLRESIGLKKVGDQVKNGLSVEEYIGQLEQAQAHIQKELRKA